MASFRCCSSERQFALIRASRFTSAATVFMGTPPPKPLDCKSVSNHRGALLSDLWADPSLRSQCSSAPFSVWCGRTSSRCRSNPFHGCSPLVSVVSRLIRTTKNPASVGKQGREKNWVLSMTIPACPEFDWGWSDNAPVPPDLPGWFHSRPETSSRWRRRARSRVSSSRWLLCLCSSSSNVGDE